MAHRFFSLVVAHALRCTKACEILVHLPGIEPMSPTLEDGFSTTGPPGKFLLGILLNWSHPPALSREAVGSTG